MMLPSNVNWPIIVYKFYLLMLNIEISRSVIFTRTAQIGF